MNSGFNLITKQKYNSFIDFIKIETKIIAFFILSISIFIIIGLFAHIFLLIIIFLFAIVAKTKLTTYWKSFKPIIIMFPILLFFNYLISSNITDATILTTQISLKIYILIFTSSILILSSTEFEIASGIKTLINPLHYLKVPVDEISLIISLGLRYIPILIFDSKTILRAQATRGLDYKTNGLIIKIKCLINTLNPLIISSFYKAEETSNSMYIRGYRVGQKRTRYIEKEEFKFVDLVLIIYFLNILFFSIISMLLQK